MDTAEAPSVEDMKLVYEFIQAHPLCDSVDVADALNMTLSKARQIAKELAGFGLITHSDD